MSLPISWLACRQQLIAGDVGAQSGDGNTLEQFRNKTKVRNRTPRFELEWIEVRLLQNRTDDRRSKSAGEDPFRKRDVDHRRQDWRKQFAAFLHDPRRHRIKTALFARCTADEIGDLLRRTWRKILKGRYASSWNIWRCTMLRSCPNCFYLSIEEVGKTCSGMRARARPFRFQHGLQIPPWRLRVGTFLDQAGVVPLLCLLKRTALEVKLTTPAITGVGWLGSTVFFLETSSGDLDTVTFSIEPRWSNTMPHRLSARRSMPVINDIN